MAHAFGKQDEIKLITTLMEEDTYMKQWLGIEDMKLMIQNIENDYPIEMGTMVNRVRETAEKMIRDVQARHQEQLHSLIRSMLVNNAGESSPTLYSKMCEAIGQRAVIAIKLKHHLTLSDKEMDLIVNLLNENNGD